MITAGVVALVFHRLRQPIVLGYILAGLIIGPYILPFPLIHDEGSINTLAQLGVILLMFSLGVDFSLRTLKRVGITAVIGAVVEILAMLWVGYELGQVLGWNRMDSLFLGAILSISSTTIAVKVLSEMGWLKHRFAEVSLGILIVEDILAIALIAVLSGIAKTGAVQAGATAELLGRIAVFLVVVLILGLIAVPPLLRYVARSKSSEMLLVTVLGLCFGISLLTLQLGYSVALGAFLIGTVIGEARESGRIKVLLEPVRDMFSAVFFVSIGMLIDPVILWRYAVPTLLIAAAVLVGKVISRTLAVFLAGNDTRTALRVGMTLAQIGEFSFIIATLGASMKVTSEFLYPIVVCVSAMTTFLSPYLIRNSNAVVGRFNHSAPRSLVSWLELYSTWVERFRSERRHGEAKRLARKWAWQMALNVALITGAFMAADAAANQATQWWPHVPQTVGGAQGLVWLGAAVIALPSLIATLRKLQAFAMLLSEVSVTTAMAGNNAPVIRLIISRTIFVAGTVWLGLWILLVSSAFLLPWPALMLLLLIVAVLVLFLWRSFIQVHAKAQVALRDALAQTPPPVVRTREPLPVILREAKLETIVIVPDSAAAGKLIRELQLRTKTGVSAVGIERAGVAIMNPGPDEEIHAGDKLLVIGSPQPLALAREYLLSGELKAAERG